MHARAPAPNPDADPLALLRLQMTPGVGPVLARRMLALFRDPRAIFGASRVQLQRVEGIGPTKARTIAEGLSRSLEAASAEVEHAARAGVRLCALGAPDYPTLLSEVPDAPLVLYVRGTLDASNATHTVAIVGSRRCTQYGAEQAERFATQLAQAGLTVVSGGARGIDSAAHRACAGIGRPTLVVLGCGIGRCYPPENAGLFNDVVDAGGAVVSELPFQTNPAPENFPARNRIISALSLGIILIEAPQGSGALITARHAVEEHGREVMALPGRVDSRASEGSHALIKRSEAALVTCPADVIEILEPQARHLYEGTHGVRYTTPTPLNGQVEPDSGTDAQPTLGSLAPAQRAILAALDHPATLEALEARTGLSPEALRAEVTALEIRRLIERRGAEFQRLAASRSV
jgi:DNA processing protein